MSLKDRLKADLKTAMRERDRAATDALRAAVGALDNAEAVDAAGSAPVVGRPNDVARRELSVAEERAVLAAEAEELRDAVAEYEALGAAERRDELAAALSVLERYL